MKIVLLFLIPLMLFANLTYSQNYEKDVAILDAFDIDASFINDPVMNEMKNGGISIFTDERFLQAMDDGYYFVPAMKNVLAKYNIPAEFLYLSLAESHFLVKAYSATAASGLWQFMPDTGRRYGLKIDEFIDERRDLIKATEAAAKYLTKLHDKFGKWYLVAIAYNCGEGKLEKAIKEAGSDKLSVLLNVDKKYIPLESRLHIRKIVALAMLANDENFLLKSEYEHVLNRANAYSIATVQIPRGESIKRVAGIIGMPFEDLQKLNKHLKYDFAPIASKEYDIYIPYAKLADFKQKYFEDKTQAIRAVHVVKKGENIDAIARKYGLNAQIIFSFNGLKNARLSLNQQLNIPNITLPKGSAINGLKTYVVKSGDTLDSIARAHNTTITNIKSKNNLKSAMLKVGDKISI